MGRLIFVVFTIVPLIEIACFILIGNAIGLWPTLALCASTGFVGAWLAKRQGLRTALEAQRALAEGRFPSREILAGACILAGGILLLTPGLLTDLMGLVLLLPPTRALLAAALRAWWRRQQGVIDVRPVRTSKPR